MIGPLMLCMLKDECTYLNLFQKMSAHMLGSRVYLQGYTSDHKKSVTNALAHEFLTAVSYICAVHAKRNISEKWSKLALLKALSPEIIKDDFGKGGLLYCDTRESCEFVRNKLTAKWNNLKGAEKKNPLFIQYFETYKKNIFCDHMRLSLPNENGFGIQLVTANPTESVNAVIKRWTSFCPKDICTFLDDIRTMIDQSHILWDQDFKNIFKISFHCKVKQEPWDMKRYHQFK